MPFAVLYFQNLTGNPQYDWIGEGVAETLSVGLKASSDLVILERSQYGRVLKELAFQQSGLVDSTKAAELGKQIGASHLLMGSVLKLEDKIRLLGRLVKVETGEIEPNV